MRSLIIINNNKCTNMQLLTFFYFHTILMFHSRWQQLIVDRAECHFIIVFFFLFRTTATDLYSCEKWPNHGYTHKRAKIQLKKMFVHNAKILSWITEISAPNYLVFAFEDEARKKDQIPFTAVNPIECNDTSVRFGNRYEQ